mgnify:CR=1 FL=1|tara:strand:- start:146 stop:895 length:750 start_codon:yes stop_codon:yes gene_type:complete
MINEKIKCPILGDVTISSKKISSLFNEHKFIYIKIFNLENYYYSQMKKLKLERGGILIEIKKDDTILAFFTLSNAVNNYLELGDLIKVKFKFSRSTFANALKIACEKSMTLLNKDGVFAYPNKLVKELEIIAGFKVNKLYIRNIYFIFFNLKLLLPFQGYDNKFHFSYNLLFKFPISILKNKILPTASKKKYFKVYKKTNLPFDIFNFFYFGFMYDFVPSKKKGDPFMVFGKDYFPESKIGFEFTDNSA